MRDAAGWVLGENTSFAMDRGILIVAHTEQRRQLACIPEQFAQRLSPAIRYRRKDDRQKRRQQESGRNFRAFAYQQARAGLAPDDLHKDNTSGGDPYGVRLPNPAADFLFEYERHGLLFVPYLRLAILEWGGFPGLAGRDQSFPPLDELHAGLEPF